MQTNFTSEQLDHPRTAEAEKILRTCVHCGLCTATCPTYVLLGDERDSPRGRIYLMKEMFESGGGASKEVAYHVDRCLSCLSCVTTCPSGVDYMHLVDMARVHIEKTHKRGIKERLIRKILAAVLPDPKRFSLALRAAALARPFRKLFSLIGLKEISAMLELATTRGRVGRLVEPGVIPAQGKRLKRVALLTGCAQQPLRPAINAATIRLLTRHGVEVVIAEKQGCCGALVHHMGLEAQAIDAARRNVDAWSALMRHEPLDAIIINASGCGTMVKDYGHLLNRDAGYRSRAETIVALTRDITEFLAEIELDAPEQWSDLKVAYHSACSMQHGQQLNIQPRALIEQAGFTVAEIPEGHICCGSAGTYNILQPELANELRDRKIRNIESVAPDLVATGNIGCITQLQGASEIPIVHTVELLDWARGGPCPQELRALEGRMKTIRSLLNEPAAAVAS
ncbi:MAG: glycolate oxidase subunit GlcF [Proteobacteria bacterium]|nr:glycolate oxidase subunit GlcF [Pseudomonadota bacterium]